MIKLNLRLLNLVLIISFVATFAIVVSMDYISHLRDAPSVQIVIWYLDTDIVLWNDEGVAKLVGGVISVIASVLFFWRARQYRSVVIAKQDKYLASMLYHALIFQGIARAFEAFFIVSLSGLHGIVFSVGKFYIILDVVSVTFFMLVSASVFLHDHLGDESRFPLVLIVVALAGLIVGLAALYATYIPQGSLAQIILVGGSLLVLLAVSIILINVAMRIFTLYKRMAGFENRNAVLVIGVQSLVYIVAMVSLIILEISSGNAADYAFRAVRAGLLVVLAYLYEFSFIKPALSTKPAP